MATKNGLVESLVISETAIVLSPGALLDVLGEELDEQAANETAATPNNAVAASRTLRE